MLLPFLGSHIPFERLQSVAEGLCHLTQVIPLGAQREEEKCPTESSGSFWQFHI